MMNNAIPPGDHERITIIGRSQGYLGLAVHVASVFDPVSETQTLELTTAYEPTPDELDRLNKGGKVIISMLHIRQHPPIKVYVGDVPK